MLRVKIDLVPFGDETSARQLAEMVIANVGQNKDGIGDLLLVRICT